MMRGRPMAHATTDIPMHCSRGRLALGEGSYRTMSAPRELPIMANGPG